MKKRIKSTYEELRKLNKLVGAILKFLVKYRILTKYRTLISDEKIKDEIEFLKRKGIL